MFHVAVLLPLAAGSHYSSQHCLLRFRSAAANLSNAAVHQSVGFKKRNHPRFRVVLLPDELPRSRYQLTPIPFACHCESAAAPFRDISRPWRCVSMAPSCCSQLAITGSHEPAGSELRVHGHPWRPRHRHRWRLSPAASVRRRRGVARLRPLPGQGRTLYPHGRH